MNVAKALYWVAPASAGVAPVHIRCADRHGKQTKVKRFVQDGVFKYSIADVPENEDLLDRKGNYFSWDKPKDAPNPKRTVTEKKVKPTPEPAKEEAPTRRLTKIEVMDLLAKRNIKFRANDKPEKLWEKVPDDIKRNFVMDKQKS